MRRAGKRDDAPVHLHAAGLDPAHGLRARADPELGEGAGQGERARGAAGRRVRGAAAGRAARRAHRGPRRGRVAERERHLPLAHDTPVHPRHPAQAAHARAQADHGALEQDGVAGGDGTAIAHAVDAHEIDEAGAVLGLGQDEHGPGLGHGLGQDRGGQHGPAPGAGDEVALVGGDVLHAQRRAGPPPSRGCGPRAGTG